MRRVTTVTNVFATSGQDRAHEQVVFCQDHHTGLKAIIALGPKHGAKRIGAGNYGGKLGPFHYHLKDLLP